MDRDNNKDKDNSNDNDNDNIVQRVLALAAAQFQRTNYKACLRLYTQAISYAQSLDQQSVQRLRRRYALTERPSYSSTSCVLNHPRLVAMLDSRAATLTKLNRLGDALKDAEMAVKVEPFNAKGYIRCGKLFQLMGNDDEALQVYVRAMKMLEVGRDTFKIKVNDALYTVLRQNRDLIRQKLNPFEPPPRKRIKTTATTIARTARTAAIKKSLDPLDYLPLELINTVLSTVPLKSALRCRQISSRWNELVPKLQLFNNLKLSPYVGFKEVSNCFRLVHISKKDTHIKRIQRLVIPSMGITDEVRILKHILSSEIQVMDTLDLSLVDTNMQQLIEILLQGNHHNATQHLKNIRISCMLIPRYEERLLQLMPNLQNITIVSSNSKKQLALPRTHTPPTLQFINLRQLTLIGDLKRKHPLIPFESLFMKDASNQIPHVTSLIIVGFDFSHLNSQNGTYNFLQHFSQVRTLVFENNATFTLRTLLKSHDSVKLPHLKKFVFREPEVKYIEGLQLYHEDYLTNFFGQLQILDLTGSCISYPGLLKLLTVCGSALKHLSIGFCSNILFQRNRFTQVIPPGGYFNFEQIGTLAPLLESLYLNQSTDLGDLALDQFTSAISLRGHFRKLTMLDLSFNNDINGYKLLDLLKALGSLSMLVLHGMDIRPETIKVIEQRYCGRVQSRLDKQYWREYGVNSYNPF